MGGHRGPPLQLCLRPNERQMNMGGHRGPPLQLCLRVAGACAFVERFDLCVGFAQGGLRLRKF